MMVSEDPTAGHVESEVVANPDYTIGLNQLAQEGNPSPNVYGRAAGFPRSAGEERTISSTGGEKGVKPQRYSLIPVEPLSLLAELYGNGAKKYVAHNFRNGYEWSKSYDAAMRHMNAFWSGEDIDPEMQVPHVICAAWHMFTLTCFMIEHPEHDDRYKAEMPLFEQMREALRPEKAPQVFAQPIMGSDGRDHKY